MKLSAGKWLGLRRLADESGLFKIVAVDQRPPIQNFIKSTLGSNEATWEDVAEVKRVLAESLADESSAVLMDPLFACMHVRAIVYCRQNDLVFSTRVPGFWDKNTVALPVPCHFAGIFRPLRILSFQAQK